MLADGEIDALITAVRPLCFTEKAPDVGRLFPDYRPVEEAYYRKTGMFPIMHMMGVRRSLAEAHPWLPGSILKACLQARAIALEEMKSTGMFYAMLPWLSATLPRRGCHGPEHVALWRNLQSKGARGDAALVVRAGFGAQTGNHRGVVRAGSHGSQVGHRSFPVRSPRTGSGRHRATVNCATACRA
jgi:hypothetical protein